MLCLSVGCSSSSTTPSAESSGPIWFEDVTEAVGLDFVHSPGDPTQYFMPQSMGSGCAFFDYDGDGLLDIYLLHQGGPQGKPNQLFRQYPQNRFTDVSQGSGLDVAGYGQGVTVGDVNNDGHPDVLITEYGAVRLFLNEGGHFAEVTKESGLANPLWGTSTAMFDYDRDGLLDVVVANYLDYDPNEKCYAPTGAQDFCGPNKLPGTCSKLFHNLGPRAKTDTTPAARVRFEDVSFDSGIGRLTGPGLGVCCADFNGDDWPDIFEANDGRPNRLWINKKDGTFRDEAVSRGLAFTGMGKAYADMGIAIGDMDRNGLLDVFVTHLATQTHTMWMQEKPGLFRDRTLETRVAKTEWRGTGFGTLASDFNQDGHLDVAIVNGRVALGGKAKNTKLGFWETYAEKNQLLMNEGNGKFRDISLSNEPFCGYWNVGRCLARGDFDNDGAPDLLVVPTGGRARLFRNVVPERGHWLKLHVRDPRHKRYAYGALVTVRAGKQQWLRLVSPAESFMSCSSPIAHFGLGSTTKIDTIDVRWLDGTVEQFDGGAVDRTLTLRKGEGRTQ